MKKMFAVNLFALIIFGKYLYISVFIKTYYLIAFSKKLKIVFKYNVISNVRTLSGA